MKVTVHFLLLPVLFVTGMLSAAPSYAQETAAKELPKGEIWFYINGYRLDDADPRFLGCELSFVIQNRTNAELKKLLISFKLKDIDFSYSLPRSIRPAEDNTRSFLIYSQYCPILRNVKPAIERVDCRLENATSRYCQSLIVVK